MTRNEAKLEARQNVQSESAKILVEILFVEKHKRKG